MIEQAKVDALEAGLRGLFSDADVESHYNFDRSVVLFRIYDRPRGPFPELEITEEALEDHEAETILNESSSASRAHPRIYREPRMNALCTRRTRAEENHTVRHVARSTATQLILVVLFLTGIGTGTAFGQESADNRPAAARAATMLTDLWRSSGAPSISMAVARNGGLVFSRSVGYADLNTMTLATPTTMYNVGSVSKIMTAVAVMQLVEDGLVDLDEPIQTYVPGYPDKGTKISVRDVMTHTSGIRHYLDDEQITPYGPYETFAEALDIFKDDSLRFEPGGHYMYSSFGINLLQGVIENVTELDFETYMRRNVWYPAAMLRTSFDVPGRVIQDRARGYEKDEDGNFVKYPYEDASYKYASGGMVSSVLDLIRFGLAVKYARLLEEDTVEEMFSPQFDTLMRFSESGNHRDITRWKQALVWRVRWDDAGRKFVYHCGTVKGFNSCLIVYLNEDMIVAIANNLEAIGFGPALDIADVFRLDQAGE